MGEIARVTKEMWGDVPVIPTMSTGATDGLYLRNAGNSGLRGVGSVLSRHRVRMG